MWRDLLIAVSITPSLIFVGKWNVDTYQTTSWLFISGGLVCITSHQIHVPESFMTFHPYQDPDIGNPKKGQLLKVVTFEMFQLFYETFEYASQTRLVLNCSKMPSNRGWIWKLGLVQTPKVKHFFEKPVGRLRKKIFPHIHIYIYI